MAVHLVTGGAGFIGSNIAEELLRQGERVRIIDNLATGKRANVEALAGPVEFMEADICDEGAIRRAVRGVEVVFHEAAIASVPRSVKDPLTTNRASVDGTLAVLLAAREAGVRRVIYASSSAVYGETPTLPKTEEMPTVPVSPYGVAKLTAELYCRAFTKCYGLETVSLRYFNVFGPRQDPKSMYAGVIPIFVRELLAGRVPTIFGDGEQTRDFTYITNVVQANLKAATASGAAGGVYNAGAGIKTSVNTLYRLVAGILGVDKPANHGPFRQGDILHAYADVSAARKVLGYQPTVTVEEGLRRTIEWLKKQ
jgi:nucleoside-diphosphate-sugar epimerase